MIMELAFEDLLTIMLYPAFIIGSIAAIVSRRKKLRIYKRIKETGVVGVGRVATCERGYASLLWMGWLWWLVLPRYKLSVEFYYENQRYVIDVMGKFRTTTAEVGEDIAILFCKTHPYEVIIPNEETEKNLGFEKRFYAIVCAFLIIWTPYSMWNLYNQWRVTGGGVAREQHTPVMIMDGVVAISAGARHTMVILEDSSLLTWGSNDMFQLGYGHYNRRFIPTEIMTDVTAVSAGSGHSMAIRADGSLWVWGLNLSGVFGDGTRTSSRTPIKVMEDVIAISAGSSYSAVIRSDGSLWAWGSNHQGQLGDGTTEQSLYPVKVMNDVYYISTGNRHTLSIRNDGSLWAWGCNTYGQLGNGTTVDSHIPIKIMEDVISVSAGNFHSMAISADGSLWAWGRNSYGEIGDGTVSVRGFLGRYIYEDNDHHLPIKIMSDVIAVSAGARHTMAIQSDGSLWAWGCNLHGALGDGTASVREHGRNFIEDNTRRLPIKVMDDVIAVSSGGWGHFGDGYTIAIRSDGSLWAWGDNSSGQLSNRITGD